MGASRAGGSDADKFGVTSKSWKDFRAEVELLDPDVIALQEVRREPTLKPLPYYAVPLPVDEVGGCAGALAVR